MHKIQRIAVATVALGLFWCQPPRARLRRLSPSGLPRLRRARRNNGDQHGPDRRHRRPRRQPRERRDRISAGIVSGRSTADPVAAQLRRPTAAYNNAATQVPDAGVTGDLGGLTFTPGVYAAASSIGLTGTVTLDAAR